MTFYGKLVSFVSLSCIVQTLWQLVRVKVIVKTCLQFVIDDDDID